MKEILVKLAGGEGFFSYDSKGNFYFPENPNKFHYKDNRDVSQTGLLYSTSQELDCLQLFDLKEDISDVYIDMFEFEFEKNKTFSPNYYLLMERYNPLKHKNILSCAVYIPKNSLEANQIAGIDECGEEDVFSKFQSITKFFEKRNIEFLSYNFNDLTSKKTVYFDRLKPLSKIH